MSDKPDHEWPSDAARQEARQQARELRDSAGEGGLRFQAYLPPGIALWLLDHIEAGTFLDPSEAAFVLLQEAKEMEPHADLKQELLKRRILQSADDPGPGIPAEEFMNRFEAMRKQPRPQPAVWKATRDA